MAHGAWARIALTGGPGRATIPLMHIIEARGLVKSYGQQPAVNGIDFQVRQGECFGLLGPNGAGKTTTMRMLTCFIPPTSGDLKVFGMDVRREPSAIKALEGVMPQDDSIDPDLSVIENLMVYARYYDIAPRVSIPRARMLLERLSILQKADDNVRMLSGGMKRRLLLARALLHEPRLLLLDEPTTGMDPHGRRDVWRILEELKTEGMTMVLCTHYMEEAQRLCDRVAIMDYGKFVAVDSPDALRQAHGGGLEDVYLKLTGKKLEV